MGHHVRVISNLVAYLSRGSIILERPHVFEYMYIHIICALKHNTHMIIYIEQLLPQELK